MQPRIRRNGKRCLHTLWVMMALMTMQTSVRATDIEGDAWPEFDIWIKMDEAGKKPDFYSEFVYGGAQLHV